MKNKKDLFEHKSKSWDMNSKRVKNAKEISSLIVKNINLDKDMTIMDFGTGTGLLSYFIAPLVKKIVAVDNSPSMLDEFEKKSILFDSETEIIQKDLSTDIIDRQFDGIISSMTIHHIEEIKALFQKFYTMLPQNGFIAIADLEEEDGTFHSDNSGVFHFGFNKEELKVIATKVGFTDIHFELANTICKPHKEFNVFLMIGVKR